MFLPLNIDVTDVPK